MAFDHGYHCEIYGDAAELVAKPPTEGIVFAYDEDRGAARVVAALALEGVWLPVVATSSEPRPGAVVEAIKAGALDYLRLPLRPERLAQSVRRINDEADAYASARRKILEARSRIAALSPREREVLDWLSEGRSNKMIARELHISPRTVEIHRANMMHKLGAEHPSQAVRMQLEAHLGAGPQIMVA